MEKRRKITLKVSLALLIIAGLSVAFLPIQAWAQDADEDGILDELDGQEVCLADVQVQGCIPTSRGIADLFIMLVTPANSLLPDNPLELMPTTYTTADGNIRNLASHVLFLNDLPQSQKLIGTTQNALLLIEDQNSSDGDLGTSQIGYPALGDGISGRVFTRRIREDVEQACALQDPTLCSAFDSNGNEYIGIDQIYAFYAKNVCSHETFHMVGRVIPPDRKLDNHYPQLGYVMDHHMYYKEYKRDKRVEWFITDKWSEADIPRFK